MWGRLYTKLGMLDRDPLGGPCKGMAGDSAQAIGRSLCEESGVSASRVWVPDVGSRGPRELPKQGGHLFSFSCWKKNGGGHLDHRLERRELEAGRP